MGMIIEKIFLKKGTFTANERYKMRNIVSTANSFQPEHVTHLVDLTSTVVIGTGFGFSSSSLGVAVEVSVSSL